MSKYNAYFAIEKKLKQNGVEVDRSVLVQEFSHGNKYGLTDLTEWELQEFNRWMRSKATELENNATEPEKCNQIRRKIIALFHKMKWQTPQGTIDLERLNAWCIKYGQFHKPLNAHNLPEVTKLCSQVEEVYKTFIAAV
jgi:hypothetical protein